MDYACRVSSQITATSQSLSSLVMHRCSLWGDANKGARAAGPPIQHKAAEQNMAGAIGKRMRNDEEERRRGGGATSFAWEWWEHDPVTHNASGVKVEGTDNSHANTHRHTYTIIFWQGADKIYRRDKAKYNKPGHAEVRQWQIEPGTSLRLSHTQTHKSTRPSGDGKIWGHTPSGWVFAFCDLHSPC